MWWKRSKNILGESNDARLSIGFFRSLFNSLKSKPLRQTTDDLNEIKQMCGNRTTKVLHCIVFFFHILAHKVHNGRVTTPFHLLVGHFLYYNNQNRNDLTMFNRIRSIFQLQITKQCLKSSGGLCIYTFWQWQCFNHNTLHPNHFLNGCIR